MKKYQKLNDNRYLCDLNFDSATDEQKIALLNQIIDNELGKPEEEVDIALVDECMAFIADLDGNRFHKSDEELTAGLQAILHGNRQTDNADSPSAIILSFKQFAKVASIFIAAALALVAIFAVAAQIVPAEDTTDSSTTTVPVVPTPHDVVITIDGIETAAYSSVDALLKGEKLNIQYPAELPDSIRLEQVDLRRYENNQMEITFRFNTADLQFHVCSNVLSTGENENAQELTRLTYGEFAFVLYLLSDGAYEAICGLGEYTYRINCTNYDDLVFMLSHLKSAN